MRAQVTRVGARVVLFAGLPQYGIGTVIETTARERRWLRAFFRRALRMNDFITVRADADGEVRLRASSCVEEIGVNTPSM